jgi:hypothetical protein
MKDALEQADRTLALVSAAYLASPYCRDEWTGAFLHNLDGRNCLLQVRIQDCDVPRLLRAQVYIDLVGLPREHASGRAWWRRPHRHSHALDPCGQLPRTGVPG